MMNTKVSVILLLLILLLSTPSYAQKGKIEWSEVPLKAQQAITLHMQDRKLIKVKKEKIILMTEDGQKNKTTIYLAGVKRPGEKKTWITVDKDGNLVDIEEENAEEVLEDQVGNKKKKNKND